MFSLDWLVQDKDLSSSDYFPKSEKYTGLENLIPGHVYDREISGERFLYLGYGNFEMSKSPIWGDLTLPETRHINFCFFIPIKELSKEMLKKPLSPNNISGNIFYRKALYYKNPIVFDRDNGKLFEVTDCREITSFFKQRYDSIPDTEIYIKIRTCQKN